MSYGPLSPFAVKLANSIGGFIRVINSTLSEVLTSEGKRFNHEFDIVFSGSETRYFLYEVPLTGEVIGLQNRIFKSRDAAAELEVIWDSPSYTPGTLERVFNENNKYKDDARETLKISEIASPTVGGVIRESDFLTGSGTGSNSSGDVSSESGYRLYVPGTHFIVKVKNLDNSNNRIILGYSWVELSNKVLK